MTTPYQRWKAHAETLPVDQAEPMPMLLCYACEQELPDFDFPVEKRCVGRRSRAYVCQTCLAVGQRQFAGEAQHAG